MDTDTDILADFLAMMSVRDARVYTYVHVYCTHVYCTR